MKCISCGNTLKVFLRISNAPRYVQRLLAENELKKDKKIKLRILQCPRCTLIQLDRSLYVEEDYYEDYLMSRTYSAFSQKYQTNLAKTYVDTFNLKNKHIMEVGCGDGFFAEKLMTAGAK